jgi:hypothetical protein
MAAKKRAATTKRPRTKKARAKTPTKKAIKKPVAKRPKKTVATRTATAAAGGSELALVQEELEAARRELARIGSVENRARRNLAAQALEQDSVEERLLEELEAVKVDLRTALAELEIARGAQARAEERAARAVDEAEQAHTAERRAQLALDAVRDQLVEARRELAAREPATTITPTETE